MSNWKVISRRFLEKIAFVGLILVFSSVVHALEVNQGAVTTHVPAATEKSNSPDFINARPMPIPVATGSVREFSEHDLMNIFGGEAIQAMDEPKFEQGEVGDGRTTPLFLGVPAVPIDNDIVVPDRPQEFGTNNHPFSTSTADNNGTATNKHYPFRASGKLFFKDGTDSYVCSASLIKRGVVVTAAHCVAAFGENRFFSNFVFVPGYRNGSAPYGKWNATSVTVLASYSDGTMSCAQPGVVCTGDVAVIQLAPKFGRYPGSSTGWYSYGYDGWGFRSGLSIASSQSLVQITQIGYPVGLNNGAYMERNDSMGFRSGSLSSNTIIGSLMTGGSSGGPWLVNFGTRPALTGTTAGTFPDANVVVGVTSWGYTDSAVKQQGASPFTSSNIKVLVDTVCANNNPRCL